MVNIDDIIDFRYFIDICLVNYVFDNKLYNVYRD